MSGENNNFGKSSARMAAAAAVTAVLSDGVQLELALDQSPGFHELDPRDRAFARNMVSTLFRRMGQVDIVLKPHIRREPPLFIKNVLRLGTVQLLILKTPVHAAVGESVEIVKSRSKYKAFAGMVNAVLRKVGDSGGKALAQTTPQDNLPGWLRGSWQHDYGRTEMRRMARQFMDAPPIDLTVKKDPDGWAQRLGGEILFGNTIRLASARSIPDLPGFDEGDWWVQDISASIPVQIAGDLAGKSVLDLCAAPGGKTAQMAAMGAKVTALDKSENRLKRVAENLERLNLKAELIAADALEWGVPERRFDLVLLDAPCSATGTFRRHPDVVHSKSPQSISRLIRLQEALLRRAARWVRPGGSLIYCTCSLQTDEGEGQAAKFLKHNSNFTISPIGRIDELNFPERAYDQGYLRLLPHFLEAKGGMDGFFTAKFDCLSEPL